MFGQSGRFSAVGSQWSYLNPYLECSDKCSDVTPEVSMVKSGDEHHFELG